MASFTSEYAAVIFPDRRRVLGKRLLPVTIEHALLLWQIGSPLMIGGRVDSERDAIVFALYVLTRDCRRAADKLPSIRTRWLLQAWAAQLWIRCNDEALAAAWKELDAHIEEAFSGPALWQEESNAKSGAPYLQWLKCSLMECFHLSPREALACSVREAIWDLACFAQTHGRAAWVSPEEAEAIEKVGRTSS